MEHFYGPFSRGTSPVDWCEGNYSVSPVIAEFVNTVSNLFFLLYPPLLTVLFREYAECVNRGTYIVWALNLVVGLSSVYFHATLSLAGQLLDEISILWLLMAILGLWMPHRYFEYGFKKRKTHQISVAILSCVVTWLAFIHPYFNAFALMLLGLPIFVSVLFKAHKCKNQKVKKLGKRCSWATAMSLLCWISDRLLCEFWLKLNFPYLHGAWHILMAFTGSTVCVLWAYFYALDTVPEQLPALTFWPSESFELGVPYVALRNAQKHHNI